MDMIRISSGKLRAIGYDPKTRSLQVEFDDGKALLYSGVGEETWRKLRSAGSAWSFYRDNIEEEFTAKPAAPQKAAPGKNPLDDLFSN